MEGPRKTPKQPKAGRARGQWASKTEYLLVVAGNVVGLGNLWRFPYLCYKYGGGAFLVPYSFWVAVCGIPLFLLETSLGQFTQEGFITCWRKVCPLAQGIGYAQLLLMVYGFAYVIIQAWALFYLVFSFRAQIPWATCNNSWNTANCRSLQAVDSPPVNHTTNQTVLPNTSTAATEFLERRMLGLSGGIEELGGVRWELALCLLASWMVCFFSIWKGIKSSGKASYFTATFPYVMLLILLVRGVTLPGAGVGIYYYLYPNLSGLAKMEVWIEAGSQVLFSFSVASGVLLVLGSYSPFNNNCYRDCFWLCLLNSSTSLVAGFVVFSVLGFMAEEQGVTVDTVVRSGPGLAFIAYPQATALLPLPQFWSVCFFLMLFLLAVDSLFVGVESFITTIRDLFPQVFYSPTRHKILVLGTCVFVYLMQLPLVTDGGLYVFELIEYYGSTRVSWIFMALSECLVVAWIFGADRLLNIIEDMAGRRPCVFFKLCWKYIIPLLSLISIVVYWINYKHLLVNDWYVYPDWAYALGWMMTLSTIVVTVLFVAWQMCLTPGTFKQRMSVLCRPAEHPAWLRGTAGDATAAELTTSAVNS